jgi:indolepyruvate ferredoxin oxidoreductase beta subunit
MSAAQRPITLTLAALGGQGGGVVASWLTAVAKREGYLAQATSVPGVAQRTGATIYYLEFFPESALPADGRRPVMALMPSPGDVDIVVAAELIEAGRAIQRGLVTPERTTLVASTHRTFTISEKSHPADGRADAAPVLAEARRRARRFVGYDMAILAEQHGAIISSVIFGAIAGASGLPFAEESYREAIRQGGIAVQTNLAAFDASLARAKAGGDGSPLHAAPPTSADAPQALLERIRREFPSGAHATIAHGVARLIDYQDERHASEYLDRIAPFALHDHDDGSEPRLTDAVARGLALWMSFEDTIRVAQLKTRPARKAAIEQRVRARPGQVVELREFIKPRVEEICGTLPAAIGRHIQASPAARRLLARFTGGREIRTSTISGYLFMRTLAGMRRWRRATLRYADERAHWSAWLDQVASVARTDYDLAVEFAHCQQLVRGYGDTHERGRASFDRIAVTAGRLAGREGAGAIVGRLRRAALADDSGEKLGEEMARLGIG